MLLLNRVLAALALAALPTVVAAADSVRKERVEFAPGETAASIEGELAGYDSVEYQVAAEIGQEMTLGLTSDNPSTYFNAYRPGDVPGQSTAVHIGPRDGNDWRATLRKSGDYTVQVFLIRAAARRGETARFTLSIAVTGTPAGAAAAAVPAEPTPAPDFADGLAGGPDYWQVAGLEAGDQLNLRAEPSTKAPVLARLDEGTLLRNRGCRMTGTQRWCQVEVRDGAALAGWVSGRYLREAVAPAGSDAMVPGTPYHATGEVPCAVAAGQPMGRCPFGVVREGGGDAVVTVTLPDGGSRTLRFEAGEAVGSDLGDAKPAATRSGDLTRIEIGGERYEIPDAVVTGG